MKMKTTFLTFMILLQGCSEPRAAPTLGGEDQIDQWKAEITLADELFAETVGSEGFSQWGSFFSPDGSVIREGAGEIRGVDEIQASMDAASSTGGLITLTWSPSRAEVSKGGDLGYTVGSYQSTGIGPDGVEMESTGTYLSIWRRQKDGSWKVEMDLGSPLTQPQPVPSQDSGAGGQDDHP